LWTGASANADGYGVLWVDGRNEIASRFSYMLHHGAIPDGLCVLHRCDTPACVNPEHLFLGTIADNNADKVSKGRQACGVTHGAIVHPESRAHGESHGMARFSAAQVRAMRALYEDGFTQAEIAEAFGTTQTHVSAIVNRKVWASVA
jgi:hypothetical protein